MVELVIRLMQMLHCYEMRGTIYARGMVYISVTAADVVKIIKDVCLSKSGVQIQALDRTNIMESSIRE